jgi:hypothetical protein
MPFGVCGRKNLCSHTLLSGQEVGAILPRQVSRISETDLEFG